MPSCEFPPEPESVAAVRSFVRQQLGSQAWEAEVVASELASNVVRHAHTPFAFSVDVGDTVRLAIRDGSSVKPALREVLESEDEVGGYGLRLVEALTLAWGYEDNEKGKTIWAELAKDV